MRTRTSLLIGMLGVLSAGACSPTGVTPARSDTERPVPAAQAASREAAAATDRTPVQVATSSTEVNAQPSAASHADSAAAATLTRVDDASAVCMVNNTYMGRPQIPVQVEGRTYYGCCEMCKGRLERDPTARYATDPVSGRQVDKAGAVIGRDASNRVLYFESEATYRKYAGT